MKTTNFGKIIKKIRKENSITQKEFANKYNVSPQTISNWESDKSLPDEKLISKISKDYNINFSSEEHILRNKVYIISFLAFSILIACTLSIKPPELDEFNYNAIQSDCKVEAIADYDENVRIIHSLAVNYCEDLGKTNYNKITAVLYSEINDETIEISSYEDNKSENNIEIFLNELTLSINDYSQLKNKQLYLLITAEYQSNINIYRIPLTITEN